MESKSAKRLLVSRHPTVFASDGRRWASAYLRPSAATQGWGSFRFSQSHHRLLMSHFLLSPPAAPDHFTELTSSEIVPLGIEHPGSISVPGSRGGFPGLPRLQMLRSLESAPTPTKMLLVPQSTPSSDLVPIAELSLKRSRASSGSSSSHSPPPRASALPSPLHRRSVPSSELSRLRRKKVSDRTRIIESLMPWERKMDTGTMLEEAYRYVRFLKAQVTALFTMPISAEFSAAPVSSGRGGALGGLEQLNRQQMLQVVVNSPRVQEKLYERGLCVFSTEQVPAVRLSVDIPSSVSAASDATG